MKTQDLIDALAADTMPDPPLEPRLIKGLTVAIGCTALLFSLGWGIRSGLLQVLMSPVLLKTLVPAVMLPLALWLALRLAQPGQSGRLPLLGLGGLVGLGLAALGVLLVQQGLAAMIQALATPSVLVCLASIPVLALPLLGAMLWALSHGAALRPHLTGAAAGLVAGTGSAAIYSLYCDQDVALFALPAYGIAIAIVILAGAAIGGKTLRW
jgi:hypothetical protein